MESNIKYLLLLIIATAMVNLSKAQNISTIGKDVIKSNYGGLTAKYAIATMPDGKTSIAAQLSNITSNTAVLVLTITTAEGAAKQTEIVIRPVSLRAINIGDVTSFSASLAFAKADEIDEKDQVLNKTIVANSVLKEVINKTNGKLNSLLYTTDQKAVVAEKKVSVKDDQINETQVKEILEIIYGPGALAGLKLTREDKEVANYFLKELVKGSCQMSVAEGIFRTSIRFNPNIMGLIKSIASSFGDNCLQNTSEGIYYKTVVDAIALKHKSAFENRKREGEWLVN